VATPGSTDPAAGDRGDGGERKTVIFESDKGKYAVFFSESSAERKNNGIVIIVVFTYVNSLAAVARGRSDIYGRSVNRFRFARARPFSL
jgi:hypothetical protein